MMALSIAMLFLLLLGPVGASSDSAFAPHDALLSESALTSHTRSNSSMVREERVRIATEKLDEIARRTPQMEYLATAIFEVGADSSKLAALVKRSALEIVGLEYKVPTGSDIATISIGSRDILSIGGPIEHRIDRYTAIAEKRLAEFIPLIEENSPVASHRVTASELRAYRIDVIGSASNLQSLRETATVRAVFIKDDNYSLPAYRGYEAEEKAAQETPSATPPNSIETN